jgi:hypothetical protein
MLVSMMRQSVHHRKAAQGHSAYFGLLSQFRIKDILAASFSRKHFGATPIDLLNESQQRDKVTMSVLAEVAIQLENTYFILRSFYS